jgi:hypothetical protein
MSDNGDGCMSFLGLIGFGISVFLLVNNVEPIVIEQQVPPPEESWSVVYPQFRDDVSSQLENTQELVGIAIRDAEDIKAQNAELKYSVDFLLKKLGLAEERYAEESKKQRREQYFLTGASILLGWIIATIWPPEKVTKSVKRIFNKQNAVQPMGVVSGASINGSQTIIQHISSQEHKQTDPVAKALATSMLVLFIILLILIITYLYIS